MLCNKLGCYLGLTTPRDPVEKQDSSGKSLFWCAFNGKMVYHVPEDVGLTGEERARGWGWWDYQMFLLISLYEFTLALYHNVSPMVLTLVQAIMILPRFPNLLG